MDELTEDSLSPVTVSPLIGHVLDSRYEILEHVGSGDSGHVFRAWDRRVQHIVAVKLLDRQFVDDADVVRSFEREARLVAGLPVHRNIVTVHDVGRDDLVPYVVMQFVAGGNLRDIVAGEAPLEVGRAFAVCQQAARGLELAHQYGTVHGNLKPENILISNRDEVKLTDFGIAHPARAGDAAGTNGRMTHSAYLSPEQELGKPPDARSDIYSLGMILYEMLTGCLPFGEEPSPSLKHSLDRAPDPSQINPDIPPAATEIVLQALARDPGNRYRSAAAFAATLHRYLLMEKGDTSRYAFPAEGSMQPGQSRARPVEKPQKKGARKSQSDPDDRLRLRAGKRRRPPLMSLVYLLTVAIAAAGGWLTYGAISRALNGSSSGSSHTVQTRTHPTAQNRPRRSGRARPRPAARTTHRTAIAGGCPIHSVGPVRLVRIWAESTAVHPGGTITFDYTVANDAPQCRDVLLGLTAYSALHPGAALSDHHADKIVGAVPGTQMYRRQFTFPAAAAGQRYDIVWSVADPSGAQIYGTTRVNGLITVSPR